MSCFADTYELAMVMVGLDPDDDAQFEDEEEVYDRLFAQFDIDFEQFEELVIKLAPLIQFGESPLTNTLYKGFGSDRIWYYKIEVKQN